jgi:hypothetical protein
MFPFNLISLCMGSIIFYVATKFKVEVSIQSGFPLYGELYVIAVIAADVRFHSVWFPLVWGEFAQGALPRKDSKLQIDAAIFYSQ